MNYCVIVAGMHRSGTSMIMGTMSILGVHLGKNVKGPSHNNQKGFYENIGVTTLNEEIFGELGTSWKDILDHKIVFDNRFDDRIKKTLVAQNLGNQSVFGIKDPRMCILFPFWANVLKSAGHSVRVIIPVRNPLSVAESLNKRDGMSLESGIALWEKYNKSILEHSELYDRIIVDYDRMLNDNGIHVRALCNFIGLEPKDMDDFVTHDLKHNSGTVENKLYGDMLAMSTKDVYGV